MPHKKYPSLQHLAQIRFTSKYCTILLTETRFKVNHAAEEEETHISTLSDLEEARPVCHHRGLSHTQRT